VCVGLVRSSSRRVIGYLCAVREAICFDRVARGVSDRKSDEIWFKFQSAFIARGGDGNVLRVSSALDIIIMIRRL